MKCVFQFVIGEDGTRSAPLTMSREDLAAGLRADVDADDPRLDTDYVLAVADLIGDDDDTGYRISQAPLVTVRHFIEAYSVDTEE